MKVWFEHAGDHSHKLRIIGRFKSPQDAQSAAKLLNDLLQVLEQAGTPGPGEQFQKPVRDFAMASNFMLSNEALLNAQYLEPVEAHGSEIIVETDDAPAQILVEAFLNHGGRIEIYSKHDY